MRNEQILKFNTEIATTFLVAEFKVLNFEWLAISHSFLRTQKT